MGQIRGHSILQILEPGIQNLDKQEVIAFHIGRKSHAANRGSSFIGFLILIEDQNTHSHNHRSLAVAEVQ